MAMVDKIAVIGAGLVGRGWAIVCARANRRVALYDSNPEALPLAMQVIEQLQWADPGDDLADMHRRQAKHLLGAG